ncbi:MAG TPA: MFS transporter [Candidatus Eisenbacteria bacterium]|nr:MFS transporter [Candidatus Eisenbacteria bacterium]
MGPKAAPWRRTLGALWLAQFLTMLGMSMFLPFLPLYLRSLGVTGKGELETMSGLLYAAPFFAAVIATPIWGYFGDRHGRKLMVMRASFGLAIITAVMGFATSPSQLLLLRILQGAISGFIAAAVALVVTTAPREKMGYALGSLQTAIPSGTIIGPLVGGALSDLIGMRYIFFITSAFNLLAGTVVWLLVREAEKPKPEGGIEQIVENYRFVFGTPQIRILFFVLLLSQFALMALVPIMALFVEELGAHGRLVATTTGAILAVTGVANIIASPRWGRRSDRQGYRATLKRALLGAGIFAVPQGLALAPWHLFVLRIPYGLMIGGIIPSVHAMIGLRAPENRRAGTMGVTSTALMMGNMMGPLVGGALAGVFGIRAVFVLSGAVFFLVLLGLWPRIEEPERGAGPPIPIRVEV